MQKIKIIAQQKGGYGEQGITLRVSDEVIKELRHCDKSEIRKSIRFMLNSSIYSRSSSQVKRYFSDEQVRKIENLLTAAKNRWYHYDLIYEL